MRALDSVVSGSSAMGGVINIIDKKGGYDPIQGSASLVYDSNAEGFQEMGSIYGAKDGFDYRVAFAGADFDDRHSADGVVPDTGYENSSFLSYLG